MGRRIVAAAAPWFAILAIGACTGLAPEGDASNPPVRGSPGSSSGAIADVPTYRGDGARTGQMPGPGPSGAPVVRWTFHADGPFVASPAVVDGLALIVSGEGRLHAIDIATGDREWTMELGAEAAAATPTLVGELAVVADLDGVVHGIDLGGREERWTTRLDAGVRGAAAAAGDTIVVATIEGTAYGLAPATGAVRWEAPLPGGVEWSVAASDGIAFFTTAGGHVVALAIDDGGQRWSTRAAASGNGGTPAVSDGMVFAGVGFHADDAADTALVALDAETGTLRWRLASATGEETFTPAIASGRAYAVSDDGILRALDARSGDELWGTDLGVAADALPALWEGVIYVATTGGTVEAFDASSGRSLWKLAIEGQPFAPVVTGGDVLVGTARGLFFAIGDPR